MKNTMIRITAICVLLVLLLSGCGGKKEAPFYGIKFGDSPDKVKSTMGTPDEFDDNGMSFEYYYDINFLNRMGSLRIYFDLDMVESMSYYYRSYNQTEILDYVEEIVAFFEKEYGEPSSSDEDYYAGPRYAWELEDGSVLYVTAYLMDSYITPSSIDIAKYN